MSRTTILIADDHKIVRLGLKALIASQKGLAVIGEAADGEEALRIARTCKPDIVIMDLIMPDVDGIEATRRIKQELPQTKVIILTSYTASDLIAQALDTGADGALLKNADDSDLLTAIRAVMNGEGYLSTDILNLMEKDPPVGALTDRQLEVLASMTQGLTNRDISRQLNICEQRVEQHVKSLFEKLGAANRAEAVGIALRKHLLKI